MRRLMVLAVIVSISALMQSAISQTASETIVVGPGLKESDAVPLATEFRVDQKTGEAVVVPMTVSGTITLKEPGLEPELHDAFYCYSGCPDGIKQENGLSFAHERSDGGQLDWQPITVFVKGNTSGNFVATPKYDESHTYTFPFACDENSQIVCGKLLALGTPIGNPAKDQSAEGSFNVSIGGAPAAGCTTIEGVVSDRESKPIPGAHVKLESAGTMIDETGTGTDGRYRFGVPAGAGSDLRVVILAEEWAHAPSRFRIVRGTETIGAASPTIDPSGSCTQTLALTSAAEGFTRIPSSSVDLAAAFDAYQSISAAWTLAARMKPEPDRGLPLPVFLQCEQSTPPEGVVCPKPGVHFHRFGGQPYIAVDTAASSSGPADMANMLGHEFGHFFMWSSFGEIPRAPGNTGHGGYYVNRSSSDSWTEGFASFYSLMVRRQVSREPEASVVGSWGDMELDGKAWLSSGAYEEFAVVGTLLDLADAPGESGSAPEQPVASTVQPNDERDLFVVDVPLETKVGTSWRAELISSTGGRIRTIHGAVIDWRGARLAIGKIPAIPFAEVRLVLRPGARATDDDPIAGDVFKLWEAILNFRSSKPASANTNNHLFDVEDLYRTAQLLYGSDRDNNENDVPDVDEIFLSHGFFADIEGGVSNQRWDPGERFGFTSHTATKVGAETYPPFVPRPLPPLLPELKARIETGGVEATALVHVDVPDPKSDSSFTMLTAVDADGLAPLPVPPPDSGGSLSVIMLADGYEPAVALEVDPKTFWPEADKNKGRSFLSASVNLERGDTLPAADTVPASQKGGVPVWAIAAIVAAVLGAGAAIVVRRRRARA